MILMAQAQTLDSIFKNLARRGALNIGEYMTAKGGAAQIRTSPFGWTKIPPNGV